jgi:uncharacterized membrane protein SpoIIM required for sporulation
MKSIFSIIAAVVFSIVLFLVLEVVSSGLSLNMALITFPAFIIVILCGGIATWFSERNKIRYSLYYGIIFGMFFSFVRGFTLKGLLILFFVVLLAFMGGFVAKNERNNIKNFLDDRHYFSYKNFFVSLFKRNRTLLIVSFAIFLVSLLIGGIGSCLSSSFDQIMTNFMGHSVSLIGTFKVNTLSVFLYNSKIAFLYMYLLGSLLGILSIKELVVTGLTTGFVVFKHPVNSLYLLPSAIFELSGYIIAVAAGFRLLITVLNMIWNGIHVKMDSSLIEQLNGILDVNYLKFRDSLILVSIAIVLILIAAIIEVNIAIPFAKHMLL